MCHRIRINDVHHLHKDKHMHIPFNSNMHEKTSHLINAKILEPEKDNK